jgi:signal transduction histidine kinase
MVSSLYSHIDSFKLLLNSPADVRVLAQPAWWTSQHSLTILGVVVPIFVAAMVWIVLLPRHIEKKTQQLAVEIQRREQTERQRVIEVERSRIARDLHDALGAALTQIQLLSIRSSRNSNMPEKGRAQFTEISKKSLKMVSMLDEIVWAVNPANDSLDHLATYFCHFTQEFFSNTPIQCRLDVAEDFPCVPITSEVRHELYLAVSEALNNTAKHSRATEVWFSMNWQNHTVQISIEDNGCGFFLAKPTDGDGLANIRHRLERIGGDFVCESRPGAGTIYRLQLPLKHDFGKRITQPT